MLVSHVVPIATPSISLEPSFHASGNRYRFWPSSLPGCRNGLGLRPSNWPLLSTIPQSVPYISSTFPAPLVEANEDIEKGVAPGSHSSNFLGPLERAHEFMKTVHP